MPAPTQPPSRTYNLAETLKSMKEKEEPLRFQGFTGIAGFVLSGASAPIISTGDRMTYRLSL